MEVIYIDSLFVLNMVLDYLLLLSCSKLCALPARRLRLGLAAFFGGVYAAAAVIGPAFFSSVPAKLLSAAAMVSIAFGRQRYIRALVGFLGLSFAFGGAVYALGAKSGGSYIRASMRVLFLSFALCYAGINLLFRFSARAGVRKTVPAELRLFGKSAAFEVLCDSGNELIDPASGESIMVVEAGALLPVFGSGTVAALEAGALPGFDALSALGLRPRLLPCRSVADSQTVLLTFRPDELRINGSKSHFLAAVSPGALSPGGEYRGIIKIQEVK